MKLILHRWLLPILAGVLYALALPPHNHGELGWVALIPLLFAVEDVRYGEAFRRGYVAGLVFFGMTTWWIVHVSLPGVVILVAFLALYIGLAGMFLAGITRFLNRQDVVWRNLTGAVAGAAGWVTLEWVRGHFPLGGFGWNFLGVTQHRFTPVIQLAQYVGVYGLSALLFLQNFVLFCTIRRFVMNMGSGKVMKRLSWEFYVVIALFAAAMMTGLNELKRAQTEEGVRELRIALVQGNIPQSLKFEEDQAPLIRERYRSLTETATWSQADLVVWPETATPGPLRYDPATYELVTNVAAAANAYLLTGTMDATPGTDPLESFNAAMLVRPDGSISATYRKMHLVPFGEYVPLRKVFPFLKWFTPIPDSFERGRERILFNVLGLNFGTVICFEDTVPGLYRQFVGDGADFMVNLTNDAWFQDSSAAEMHLANAIFRAVETRRWLIRCTNHGVTCAVSPTGIVHARTPKFQPGIAWFQLRLPATLPATVYVQHGDILVAGCAVLAGLAVTWMWRLSRCVGAAGSL